MRAGIPVRAILCLILALLVAQDFVGSDLARALGIVNGVLVVIAIVLHVRAQPHKPVEPKAE